MVGAMAIAHHSVLRLHDDRVLAPSTAARRTIARSVLHAGEPFGLICARAADTHLHLVSLGSEAHARELNRRLALALSRVLAPDAPFVPARVRPIHDQWHLQSAFEYVLRQERRHAVSLDPLHDASTLPDLLGMRVIAPWLPERIAAHLPRLRTPDLWRELGVADRSTLDREPLQRRFLAEAAAAAFGLASLDSKSAHARAARSAAVALAGDRLKVVELATLLGVDARTIRRVRVTQRITPPDPTHVRAVRLQLAVRSLRARLEADLARSSSPLGTLR